MGKEIDLLINYPRTKRDVESRALAKSEEDRLIARKFDIDFFDGDRSTGYGGFSYNSRYWYPVIPTFKDFYRLNNTSKVLDIGCAKGFMLNDMIEIIPGITVRGIDISSYAIEKSLEKVKNFLITGDAQNLPYHNNEFDLVISINTIHNLDKKECGEALKEIMRVSKGNAFITVDAYRNEIEKERMFAWNLTAKTIMHVDEWKLFFNEVGYTGDYYWFIP